GHPREAPGAPDANARGRQVVPPARRPTHGALARRTIPDDRDDASSLRSTYPPGTTDPAGDRSRRGRTSRSTLLRYLEYRPCAGEAATTGRWNGRGPRRALFPAY